MNTNIVIVAGNLTRDPELRFTPNGSPVCEFGIANNRRWKTDKGEEKEDSCFVSCVAWGSLAENITKYCKKGNEVLVEGRLKFEQWEKNGEKRSMLKINCEKASWPYRKDQEASDIPPRPKKEPNRAEGEVNEDEIPF